MNNIDNLDIARLIKNLKKEDTKYANLCRGIQVIYWVLSPMYLFLVGEEIYSKGFTYQALGGTFFFMGMIVMAMGFSYFNKVYRYVDYSQPTLIMLKNVVRRYKPFSTRSWWIIPALIFIDLGLSFNNFTREHVITTQIFFWSVMLVSIIIGLIWWKIRYKYIVDDAKKMIKEIEN